MEKKATDRADARLAKIMAPKTKKDDKKPGQPQNPKLEQALAKDAAKKPPLPKKKPAAPKK